MNFSRPLPMPLTACMIVLLLALSSTAAWAAGEMKMETLQGESLEELLHRASRLSTFDVSTLYIPPSESDYGQSFKLLGHGRVTLNLAQNATIFDADDKGLGVGKTDGLIATFGPLACPSLDPNPDADEGEPLADAVQLLAYGQDSQYLAAKHAGVDGVSIFDLKDCELDRRLDISGVTAMAMARAGDWLALAGSDGQVLVGKPTGKLKPIEVQLPSMLGIGFGTEGGVLYVVAKSGETVVWDMVNGQELSRFQPRGGPFVSVAFHGQYMGLADASGKQTAWDMASREQVPYTRQLAQFFIADQTLRYTTWNPILRARNYRYAPTLGAWHSASLGMIRVDDLDGAERCYDTGSGLARPCATAPDFEHVNLTPLGGFFLGDIGYRLADVAYWWDHDVLVSRFIEGQGWFLWWAKGERLKEYSPLPEYLPERKSIRADQPTMWSPVVPPAYYP